MSVRLVAAKAARRYNRHRDGQRAVRVREARAGSGSGRPSFTFMAGVGLVDLEDEPEPMNASEVAQAFVRTIARLSAPGWRQPPGAR